MQSHRRSLYLNIAVILVVALAAFWAGRASRSSEDPRSPEAEAGISPSAQRVGSSLSQKPDYQVAEISEEEIRQVLRKGRAAMEAVDEDYDSYFYTLMEQDPEKAFHFLLSLNSKDEADHILLTSALQMIVKTDPSRALSLLGQLPNPRARKTAIQGIVFSWGFEDPSAALNFARSHAEGRDGALWMDVATRWGAEKSPEAVAYLATLEPGLLRNKFMQGLANGMMNRDLDGFISWYGSLSDHEAASVQKELHLSTNETLSFEQLTNFWDVMPPGQTREDLVAGMSFTTKFESPDDFRQFVKRADSLQDDRLRAIMRQAAIEHYASENPTEAISLMSQLSPEDSQMVAAVAATQWATREPGEALNWAKSLSDPAAKNSALFGVIQSTLSDGTETAMKIIEETPTLLTGEPGEIILGRILEESGDPRKLLRLTETLPDQQNRQALQDSLLDQWVSQDQYGFAQWANELEKGSQRDRAVGTLSRELLTIDPDAAMDWSMSITDQATRQKTVKELARQWQNNDTRTAQTWLESNTPLAQNVRALLADSE